VPEEALSFIEDGQQVLNRFHEVAVRAASGKSIGLKFV
jgi:hypothetical protein